jgi:hypothetical protein
MNGCGKLATDGRLMNGSEIKMCSAEFSIQPRTASIERPRSVAERREPGRARSVLRCVEIDHRERRDGITAGPMSTMAPWVATSEEHSAVFPSGENSGCCRGARVAT